MPALWIFKPGNRAYACKSCHRPLKEHVQQLPKPKRSSVDVSQLLQTISSKTGSSVFGSCTTACPRLQDFCLRKGREALAVPLRSVQNSPGGYRLRSSALAFESQGASQNSGNCEHIRTVYRRQDLLQQDSCDNEHRQIQ